MTTVYRALSILAALILCGPVYAVTDVGDIQWDAAYRLLGTNGVINPDVLVGFNPQPDPPGSDPSSIADLFFVNPTTARFTLTGQSNPQKFQFFFALNLAGSELVVNAPEIPLSNFESLTFGVDAVVPGAGSTHICDVDLGFTTSSAGLVDFASLVGFNPQPDPPLGYAGGALLFEFTSLSDAIVTFRLLDASGDALQLRQVSEPGTMALIGLGLFGFGLARLRKLN